MSLKVVLDGTIYPSHPMGSVSHAPLEMMQSHCETHNSYDYDSMYCAEDYGCCLSLREGIPSISLCFVDGVNPYSFCIPSLRSASFSRIAYAGLLRQIDTQLGIHIQFSSVLPLLTNDRELQRVVPLFLCSLIVSFLMSWNRKLILGVCANE